ncbi:cobalt ECF transporter T component CbiQ [Brucella sp. 191011898]|uniref:cobalt ECF transporter T component CbiQ n=1 Tax=Brucella sp. 191011898 TaxID=2730447 RepID=UPI0015DF4FEE|nr:cobalt ECF transporter T component CbiQ [Brucella sp. 191011898]CAB4326172.1 cobalt ABC transporter permease CbiQ [Brucella sp. 191011898]
MTPATDFVDQGPANNPIDRLHPKTRLVMTLAILIFATIIHNPIVLAISMAAAIILVRIAKAPWHKLRHRLLHLEGFMIVLLVLLPFTMPGRPLLELGPLVATVEGTVRALTVAIKVNICVLSIYALLGSLDPIRIGQAAESLGLSPKFVRLFLITVRYVSVFRAETGRLSEAMRVRGFHPRSNMHTWRTFGNLAGTMVVRSIERAERVDEAMRCRGFSGTMPATPATAAQRRDAVFASLFFCAMFGLLLVEFIA